MKTDQKGFSIPLIAIIVSVLILGAGAYYVKQNPSILNFTTNNQETASSTPITTENTAVKVTETKVDPTANWKTYTSDKLGLSFKYPPEWGEIKEVYKEIKPGEDKEFGSQGKSVAINFSNYNWNDSDTIYPEIYATSKESSFFESSPYTGTSFDDLLKRKYSETPISEPTYFKLANVFPAIKFVAGDMQDKFSGPSPRHIAVYTQLQGNFPGGLSIIRYLTKKEETSEQKKDFLEKYKNNLLNQDDQKKLDEFNLFISTFKKI